MDKLTKELGIDESHTKPIKKAKEYTHVKDNVYPKEDYNFMADLLALPTTKEGYRYLLVVLDLWTDEFDIEPMKTKKSSETLIALKKIFKRKYLNKPYASIQTDQGSEFKGNFKQWLFNSNILHRQAKKGRHSQMSNVERLNRTLGRLLNGLMNTKEKQTGEAYKEWIKYLAVVRTKLNKYRRERREKMKNKPTEDSINIFKDPKYKVGDSVYHVLDVPQNILGKEQPTHKFREGDRRWSLTPRKIKQVLYYDSPVQYRYRLEGMDNVSYTENQLKK